MLKEDLDALHDLHAARLLQEATAGGPAHVAEATQKRLVAVIYEKVRSLLWFRAMDDRREAVEPAQQVPAAPYSFRLPLITFAMQSPNFEVGFKPPRGPKFCRMG